MTAAISDETDIGFGWKVHEQIERAMNEEKWLFTVDGVASGPGPVAG